MLAKDFRGGANREFAALQNQIAVPPSAVEADLLDLQARIRTLSSVEDQHGSPSPGLELVELELALDSVQAEQSGFTEAIGAAVKSLGGEFLFSLPASGLADGQQKIAAVRLPSDDGKVLLFVLLSEDGRHVTVRAPDEETARLADFSQAFIGLLENFRTDRNH